MFEVKKYKIGDIVKYKDKFWEIKDINTNGVPIDAEYMIELGLANEEKFYSYILLWLVSINNGESIFRYLNEIYEEIKDMKSNMRSCCENFTGTMTTNCNTFGDGDLFIDGKYVGKFDSFNKSITLTKNDPVIVDYKVINNTVVIFTFADGTTEKTVCNHEFDEFELKRAVELAICKKKFGGTKAYHKAVNNAIKQIEDIDAKKKAESADQERIAHRKAKYAERQAKRKAKRRQEQIDIQTEAFYNAMIKYDDTVAAADLYTEYAPDKNVENTETE